ncbi:RluA family pseudouridine synthase [Aureliella helgolandensis]|uniref:Ribosomal large subunit pseudouridine synthase C n=1 Tax=Aureliella helgolandensis TaxID=2527968 RepID=A0A518GHI9_9BACT|nr:RluA family pseudouridine synthase [Aureliella helgolandensis]QDV28044.1 Ribosomal large subunit pseudouridine synthase C [Aureliella helgolandensis]
MSKQSPPKAKVYHLSSNHTGLTLAGALKELSGEGASWNQVKKLISRRCVQVNGNLCLDEARRVSEKDIVKVFEQPQAKPVEPKDVKIAYIDEHLIVVEKPAGVTSVRHVAEKTISTRRRQLQPTMEELLPPILAKLQHLRWPPLPPKGMNRGRFETNVKRRKNQKTQPIQNSKKLPPELQVIPVHRLDRDTSGLMLFARHRDAEQKLVSMFRRHTIQREYLAVCRGQVQPQTITSLLARDRGDGVRGSVAEDASDEEKRGALKAVTHIVSADHFGSSDSHPGYSFIRCQLETGRTHQIRIHLSEAGHPLCGDKIYHRQADGTTIKDSSGAPRQTLHSDHLEFTHPITGLHLRFDMATPLELTRWLKRLRGE